MTDKNAEDPSKKGAWILATRPRTLPAAIAPVVLGSATAVADKSFGWLPAVAALIVALLCQSGK
jgi:1,4-dihydroxy-2-naphthoate octaprenyltransferase